MVMRTKEKQVVPNVFGQIILAIGDVIVEVQKGKVSLRHGNEDDVLNILNTTENFSDFLSSYLDNVVIHNSFNELSMQDPLEKSSILQDPYKMVDVVELKISLLFEARPPRGKTNNVNHMIKKLRRGNALKVKFSLGEPPD